MRRRISRARGPPPGRSAHANERLERFGGKYVKTIKIKDYYGKYQTIPVDDHLYEEWQAMQREENRLHKYEVYHCFSMDPDQMDEEAHTSGVDDLIDELIRKEETRRLYESIDTLTPIQRRRVLMFMDNMSYSDIARAEKRDLKVVIRSLTKSFDHLRRLLNE